MKIRFVLILVFLGVLSGCGQSTTPVSPSRATITVHSRLVSVTLAPTPTVSLSQLKQAGLKINDLPGGFQQLDEDTQAQLGLTPDKLAQSFEESFRQAAPIQSFAFYNPDEQHFEIILGIIFYPLTASEQSGFDRTVATPINAVINFSQGFGGHAMWAPDLGHLGDASVGWSFINVTNPPNMQGQMFIARRESVVFLLMTLYMMDQIPPASAANLGQILDERVKAGLGETK